jgi:thiol-disulfide isomerase/thioredoxin
MVGLNACSDLEGTGDKGYITGDGVWATVAADDRDDVISFEGADLDGDELAIQDFRGKPVVVVVWGSWCAPCRDEAPDVVAAAEELGDDVQFVGINIRDSDSAQAQAFVRKFGVPFPSFYSPDGEALLAFPGVLGLRTIPAFAVLDREGRVAASIIGKLPSKQTLVDLTEDVVRETRDG